MLDGLVYGACVVMFMYGMFGLMDTEFFEDKDKNNNKDKKDKWWEK